MHPHTRSLINGIRTSWSYLSRVHANRPALLESVSWPMIRRTLSSHEHLYSCLPWWFHWFCCLLHSTVHYSYVMVILGVSVAPLRHQTDFRLRRIKKFISHWEIYFHFHHWMNPHPPTVCSVIRTFSMNYLACEVFKTMTLGSYCGLSHAGHMSKSLNADK